MLGYIVTFRYVLVVFFLILAPRAFAQPPDPHQEHGASPAQHQHAGTVEMPSLFAAREASGTSWLPDETPMHAAHWRRGDWQVMLHGTAFAQFLYEPGDRHRTGGFATDQISAVNWGMVMARRPAGRATIGLRATLSVEPWTVSDCGFINFLATGEICEGDTIHDRQHPHDLFMELAAEYDRPLRGSLRWQLYAGLSGEPALGPPGFPHRPSAQPNPIAPIAHHWLDSTHITFGLVTAGVYDRRWKAEATVFNGREPDENRADLDLAPLDSVSGRFSWLPTRRLSLQVSAAHLNDAHAQLPPQAASDVDRTTASATYHASAGDNGIWATTVAYGINWAREFIPDGSFATMTQAFLVESAVTVRDRHTWFGRAEVVEKPAEELHAHEYPTSIFTVGKLEGGYMRQLRPWKGLLPGIGGVISFSVVPPELASRYDGRVAPGFGLFFNVRPGRHPM